MHLLVFRLGGYAKIWIRKISATAGQICSKFWNQDLIFAMMWSKEMIQIDPSTFLHIFCKLLCNFILCAPARIKLH